MADAGARSTWATAFAHLDGMQSGGRRMFKSCAVGSLANMRMQLTRPRERWPAAGRWTSASLQLIRGR
jgi:hypothetical protein